MHRVRGVLHQKGTGLSITISIKIYSWAKDHSTGPSEGRKSTRKYRKMNWIPPQCPKRFTKKYDLNAHIRKVHEGVVDPPSVCSDCGQTFKDKDQLRFHNNKYHSTDERFQCMECGLRFGHTAQVRRLSFPLILFHLWHFRSVWWYKEARVQRYRISEKK